MLALRFATVLSVVVLCLSVAAASPKGWIGRWRKENPVWRGVHYIVSNDRALADLAKQVPALKQDGVNVLILEIGYSFAFHSRPEMNDPYGITRQGARMFADVCHQAGIRVIPQMNCLGHQSWAETTAALLVKHPELDETPGLYPKNKDIYCRSWCPRHPDLAKILFPMIDDVIDAFDADAFHVGMDEVFLIGADGCPRCKGTPTATLFAEQVNVLHKHLVGQHKVEMFMWGDRFLDGKATGYGEWEASENGTAAAVDQVPKDIVLCDWHYEKRKDYPSLKILTDKGFRVWPSGWKDPEAANAFARQAKELSSKRIVGYLCTTWGSVEIKDLPAWPALVQPMAIWR